MFRYHEPCLETTKKQFPDIQCLQPTEKNQFGTRQTASGSIIFHYRKPCHPLLKFITMDGKFHWVASVNVEGQIYVLDGLFSGTCHLPYRSNWPACIEETSIPLQFELPRYSNKTKVWTADFSNLQTLCKGSLPLDLVKKSKKSKIKIFFIVWLIF